MLREILIDLLTVAIGLWIMLMWTMFGPGSGSWGKPRRY
jgi:hypothetical protein